MKSLLRFSRQRTAWWDESEENRNYQAIVTTAPCVTLRRCQMLPDIENADYQKLKETLANPAGINLPEDMHDRTTQKSWGW